MTDKVDRGRCDYCGKDGCPYWDLAIHPPMDEDKEPDVPAPDPRAGWLREKLRVLQDERERLARLCWSDKAHNHALLRALEYVMPILQEHHDSLLGAASEPRGPEWEHENAAFRAGRLAGEPAAPPPEDKGAAPPSDEPMLLPDISDAEALRLATSEIANLGEKLRASEGARRRAEEERDVAREERNRERRDHDATVATGMAIRSQVQALTEEQDRQRERLESMERTHTMCPFCGAQVWLYGLHSPHRANCLMAAALAPAEDAGGPRA